MPWQPWKYTGKWGRRTGRYKKKPARVWRNRKTGRRFYAYDFSFVGYGKRNGKYGSIRGPTSGLGKYRHKRTGNTHDPNWGGYHR